MTKGVKHDMKISFWIGGTFIFVLIFLLTTNPQNLSPIFLIVPFILLFLLLFMAIIYVAMTAVKLGHLPPTNKNLLFAGLLAGYPVMLLLLQSIGQLSARDVITLTLLLIISSFYVKKTSFST